MRKEEISKNGKNRELDVAVSMLREPWSWEHGAGLGEWNAVPSVVAAHAAVSIAQSLKDIATELRGIRKELGAARQDPDE